MKEGFIVFSIDITKKFIIDRVFLVLRKLGALFSYLETYCRWIFRISFWTYFSYPGRYFSWSILMPFFSIPNLSCWVIYFSLFPFWIFGLILEHHQLIVSFYYFQTCSTHVSFLFHRFTIRVHCGLLSCFFDLLILVLFLGNLFCNKEWTTLFWLTGLRLFQFQSPNILASTLTFH